LPQQRQPNNTSWLLLLVRSRVGSYETETTHATPAGAQDPTDSVPSCSVHSSYFDAYSEFPGGVGKPVTGAKTESGDRFDANASRPFKEAQCVFGNFKTSTVHVGTDTQAHATLPQVGTQRTTMPPFTRDLTVTWVTFYVFSLCLSPWGQQGRDVVIDTKRSRFFDVLPQCNKSIEGAPSTVYSPSCDPRGLVGEPWVNSPPTSLPKPHERRDVSRQKQRKTCRTDHHECACTRPTFLSKTANSRAIQYSWRSQNKC
jgi:hypothetical protein